MVVDNKEGKNEVLYENSDKIDQSENEKFRVNKTQYGRWEEGNDSSYYHKNHSNELKGEEVT